MKQFQIPYTRTSVHVFMNANDVQRSKLSPLFFDPYTDAILLLLIYSLERKTGNLCVCEVNPSTLTPTQHVTRCCAIRGPPVPRASLRRCPRRHHHHDSGCMRRGKVQGSSNWRWWREQSSSLIASRHCLSWNGKWVWDVVQKFSRNLRPVSETREERESVLGWENE